MFRYAGLGVAALGCVAALAIAIRGIVASNTPAESFVGVHTPGAPLPVLWNAPAFDLRSSTGARVKSQDLVGKVWIANFIFTQCTSVCPMMTAKLTLLQRQLGAPDLRFVSVSVDPVHDDPAALAAYASHWRADARWLLLSASEPERDELARGLRVAVVATEDDKNPIIHSKLLTLVDERGRVRGVYDSDDAAAWRRLATDARLLLRTMPAALQASIGDGAQLKRFGCTGCHDRPAIAPRLHQIGGRLVTLATGERIFATDAYLRESILRPSDKLVAGYAPLMPSYAGVLSEEELAELIAEMGLASEPEPADSSPAAGGPATDPECHMQVATVDPVLALTVDGKRYHFCSARCLAKFRAAHVAR